MVSAVTNDVTVFTLLHTNDFHNHLKEAQGQQLHDAKSALQGRGLLLDAGDAVGSGNVTFHLAGEPILDRMSDIGYDVMTAGNREFHLTRVGFEAKVKRARFPVLCANVRPEGAFPLPVRPFMTFNVLDGVRVVVFGLTVPMVTERMLARKASSYVFDDPIEVAARLVPQLREEFRPNLMIGLTHIGIQQDRKLAADVPGIDLIIGGHTHVTLPEGERVGDTLVVQADCFAHCFGRVEVEAFADSGNPARLRARLESLSQPLTNSSMNPSGRNDAPK